MRSLVRHYRNHPSANYVSIGNEMPDQTTDQGVIIARNLTAYCHDEDPTAYFFRGVISGMLFPVIL